ncbi:YdcF family protein [uncultured Corynebacterium sp.]|uniref:YdcF family protein n=1 Tax=uncultured Corynebacterium sp. TaxID=159447 RepID=UPI0025D466BD|nr:YdcF family protein [uncultured Corynebacterium sp.]
MPGLTTSPRPAFAVLTAIPGLAMASVLAIGGVVAWRDPVMRPPRLPNRRPPNWGLPVAGVAYGAGVLAAARAVARGSAGRGSAAASTTAPTIASAVASVVALSTAAVPGLMLPIFDVARRTWARRDRGPAGTILVLGCALRHGRPSTLLRLRLELAETVARRATGPVTVICCGGIGEDGGASEAEVMRDWLHARGIADVRVEPTSTSTFENLRNATPMVERAPVTVVTSDFHVFRAGSLARRGGMADWRVEGAPTPARYWATSMLREFLALATWWPAPGVAVGATLVAAWFTGAIEPPVRREGSPPST